MLSYTQDQSKTYNNSYFLVFLIVIATLITIGLIFIYSSSSVFALEKTGSAQYYVKKQLFGLILGLFALITFRYIPLKLIKKFTPLIFFINLSLTLLTLLPQFGTSIHGSKRWLNIMGITIQPSEFLKIALLLYIAFLIDKKSNRLNSFLNGFFPLLFVLACTSIALLKQPDFGQTVTLAITSFLLFFLAQFKTKHLLATIAPLIPIASLLVLLKPYRLKRVLTFLNPWQDPQGSGFQIIQSLIAIGSGNLNGLGIAKSKQKFFYLPMQHTDFIFSIIAEEMGFIGSFVLIFLYMLFLYTGFKLALSIEDTFGHYIIMGFVILTSIQSLINIMVASGLVPTKGLGLPFISYGNSALLANLILVGIIINVVKNQEQN